MDTLIMGLLLHEETCTDLADCRPLRTAGLNLADPSAAFWVVAPPHTTASGLPGWSSSSLTR